MNISLVGYGKMGRAIERIARERGHNICAIVDINNPDDILTPEFRAADVIIEFTTPATAVANYRRLLPLNIPLVSGTTGWTAELPQVKALVEQHRGEMLWSSNFSLGVNILFELNRRLAAIMQRCREYVPSIHEVHHIHKLDHPSGTAITLAEDILNNDADFTAWAETPAPQSVLITHERIGEEPGTHTVTWASPVDTLSISHHSLSRDGLALGAVLAAEWLPGHPGFHTMSALMAHILGRGNS